MQDAVLSDDAKIVLLLCTRVGLDKSSELKPLGPKAWSSLERRFQEIPGESAARLAGKSVEDMVRDLGIPLTEAHRVAGLLERSGRFAIELDRLWSRGIWTVTRLDAAYPSRLRERLADAAPPVLFGAGPLDLLKTRAVAIVGSRAADQEALSFTEGLATEMASEGIAIVSGAARGVDEAAMLGALGTDGLSVGVLGDSLERQVLRKQWRRYLTGEQLVMISPYHPAKPFDRAGAMGRNKIVYCLSDAAVVVTSALGKGGTWSGAVEALNAGWVPVFARSKGELGNEGTGALITAHGAHPLRKEIEQAGADLLRVLGRQSLRRGSAGETSGEPEATPLGEERQTEKTADFKGLADEAGSGQESLAPDASGGTSPVYDPYQDLLPILLLGVYRGLRAKDGARSLGVVQGQWQTWVTRAVNEGLVHRKSKGLALSDGGIHRVAESALGEYDDVQVSEAVEQVHERMLRESEALLVGVTTKWGAQHRLVERLALTRPQADELIARQWRVESEVEHLFEVDEEQQE